MATIYLKHGGKIGDLLYSLYYVRDLIVARGYTDCVLYLQTDLKEPDKSTRLSVAAANWVKPLLEATHLFSSVEIGNKPPTDCIDLNYFRMHENTSHGDIKLWYYDVDIENFPMKLWEPILSVTPSKESVGKIVVTKTHRYNNSKIDYKWLYRYRDRSVFVGTDQEYKDFCKSCCQIERKVVRDALECAEYMAGSSGVVVNASGLCAIAEILKVPRVFVDAHPPVVHPIGGEFRVVDDPFKFEVGVTWLATRESSPIKQEKHNTAIFCTHSQFKQDVYTQRIIQWHRALDFLHDKADFYTVVDGKLNTDNRNRLNAEGVTVVDISPWIGRNGFDDFRGFKRSFGTAIKLLSPKYEYITHIENDAVVINKDKLLEYINKRGLWSGWLHADKYPESAFCILNDHSIATELGDKYSSKQYYADCKCFEHCLQKYQFQYPFSVKRIEGSNPDTKLDVWTQYTGYFPAQQTFR